MGPELWVPSHWMMKYRYTVTPAGPDTYATIKNRLHGLSDTAFIPTPGLVRSPQRIRTSTERILS